MAQRKSNAAAAPLPSGRMPAVPDLAPCPFCGYFAAATGCEACGGSVLDGPRGQPVEPGRRFWMVELVHGFVEFYRAAIHLMTRPEYFGRLAVPIAANLVATALLFALIYYGVFDLMQWIAARPWGWLSLMGGPALWGPETFAWVLTALVVVTLGASLLQTLTIPFLDPLADAVEKMLGGDGLKSVVDSPWKGLTVNVRASAQVLAMQLLVLVPCLLISFCHLGIGLALLAAALLNALLWFEIPFARRGYTIEQRIRIVRHNWGRTLGFGLAFQLGMAIPVFNFLLLAPTAAVAVSMLYFHLEKAPAHTIPNPTPNPTEANQQM